MKNHLITLSVLSLLSSLILAQEDVQIIKPGAPGQSSEIIGEEQAIQIADSSYIKADVDFLQGMIMHHEQAVLMSSYVQSRTNSKNINDLAGRIDASQKDEIDFMQSWLSDRDEKTMGMMKMMKGMATDYQLEQLSQYELNILEQAIVDVCFKEHVVENIFIMGSFVFGLDKINDIDIAVCIKEYVDQDSLDKDNVRLYK